MSARVRLQILRRAAGWPAPAQLTPAHTDFSTWSMCVAGRCNRAAWATYSRAAVVEQNESMTVSRLLRPSVEFSTVCDIAQIVVNICLFWRK